MTDKSLVTGSKGNNIPVENIVLQRRVRSSERNPWKVVEDY